MFNGRAIVEGKSFNYVKNRNIICWVMNEHIQHMFVIAIGYAIKYERKLGFEHSIMGKWCFYHGDEYLANVNVKEFSKYHLKGFFSHL